MRVEISATSADRAAGRERFEGAASGAETRIITLGSAADRDWVLPGSAQAHHAELHLGQGAAWLCAHAPVGLDGQTVEGWARISGVARLSVGDRTFDLRLTVTGDRAGTLPAADERERALAESFVRPPAEQERDRSTLPGPLLRRRVLFLPIRAWLAVAGVGLATLVAFSSPQAPASRAVRTGLVARPRATSASVLPASLGAPTAKDARPAAEALFLRDEATALARYRELAADDPRFMPFVRVLERRQGCSQPPCADEAAR